MRSAEKARQAHEPRSLLEAWLPGAGRVLPPISVCVYESAQLHSPHLRAFRNAAYLTQLHNRYTLIGCYYIQCVTVTPRGED